jgi:hypothetical protein
MNLEKILSGKFLKAAEVKQGDTITFLDAGVEKELNGKMLVNFTVDYSGDEKIYSPNKTSLSALADAWGMDTTEYVGKKAKILLIKVRNPSNGEICDSITLAPETV